MNIRAREAAQAIRYLAEHGYESTTAGELADAIGMSRSTFFRRFGSKEDVVFVDHELALATLQRTLESTSDPAQQLLGSAILEVMSRLTHDTEAARLRSELLRHTPALRERELVITHRYERVFAAYLEQITEHGTPAWVPVSLAAALVAVHNAALRRLLRGSGTREIAFLERDIAALLTLYSPWVGGAKGIDPAESRASQVLVAAFPSSTPPEQILRTVAMELGADPRDAIIKR